MFDRIFFTCEHGGNRVPTAYRELFRGRRRVLESHRGYDAGALSLARFMARRMHAPLFAATTTRLLVDLNRSAHNPRVFSFVTRRLPRAARLVLLERHHAPHWTRVADFVRASAATPVAHVAVHSFTPVWDGRARPCDIGLLYDPRRKHEKGLGRAWKRALEHRNPALRVRSNYPYLGYSDGLPTALRRSFGLRSYVGLELEVNQRWVADPTRWKHLRFEIQASLAEALAVVW